jgi:hypothetical protein
MTVRPATSMTLTHCWYTLVHHPGSRRTRSEAGVLHALCRHCDRPIKSQGGKSWTLADGVDLDELAERSSVRFICVTSVADGLVIARYPIGSDLDDAAVKVRIQEVSVRHGASEPGAGLDVRLMGGPSAKAG